LRASVRRHLSRLVRRGFGRSDRRALPERPSSAAGRKHERAPLPRTTAKPTQDLPGPLQRFGSALSIFVCRFHFLSAKRRFQARPSSLTEIGTSPRPLVPTSSRRFWGCTERSAIGDEASVRTSKTDAITSFARLRTLYPCTFERRMIKLSSTRLSELGTPRNRQGGRLLQPMVRPGSTNATTSTASEGRSRRGARQYNVVFSCLLRPARTSDHLTVQISLSRLPRVACGAPSWSGRAASAETGQWRHPEPSLGADEVSESLPRLRA
jgi:hypothetical protein